MGDAEQNKKKNTKQKKTESTDELTKKEQIHDFHIKNNDKYNKPAHCPTITNASLSAMLS